MSRAFVGLGANVGDAAATLRAAMAALGELPGTACVARSQLYRTPAWGVTAQADFVNAVAELETTLAPRDLLDALLALERRFGRDRSAAARWGPRTLDLDLLLYDALQLEQPGLQLPHPHLHQRAFVLVPLLEIAPHVQVPGIGAAHACLAHVALDGIEALT